MIVLVTVLIICWATEMVIEADLSGSVTEDQVHVVLIADSEKGEHIEVGQPVRLEIDGRTGWGMVVEVSEMRTVNADQIIRAVVALIGPQELRAVVPGQAAQGHVLIGFAQTIRGLWQLVTDQPQEIDRHGTVELRNRIPTKLRNERVYGELEQRILSGD